jgi:tripartite-type tricarboxylate transporter receptor subunit TctC
MRSIAIFIALALSAALAQAADDQTVWIASGTPGGTYRDMYARNLARQLRDYKVFHRETSGSGENLDLLATGKADLAFSQADIYAARLKESPDRYGDLVLLGKLSDECVYIAHRAAGPVRSLGQLGESVDGRPARIAVGPEQSGASGTWHYLTLLQPALAVASVRHDSGTLALNQLVVGAFERMSCSSWRSTTPPWPARFPAAPGSTRSRPSRPTRAGGRRRSRPCAPARCSSRAPVRIPSWCQRWRTW